MTFSFKKIYPLARKRFIPKLFHPKTHSCNDTFSQKHVFIQRHFHPNTHSSKVVVVGGLSRRPRHSGARREEGPNFSVIFPPASFSQCFSLSEVSLGIVAGRGQGPPKLCVWASLVWAPAAPKAVSQNDPGSPNVQFGCSLAATRGHNSTKTLREIKEEQEERGEGRGRGRRTEKGEGWKVEERVMGRGVRWGDGDVTGGDE